MIKWKSVGIALAVIGIFAAINILFIDQWVKRGTEKSLEAAAGAKVEIESADLHFYPSLGVTFKDIQIADKNHPFQNIIQLDEVSLDLQSELLLESKFIIQTIALKGASFGTPRKTSGALPIEKKEPPSKLAKKTSELMNEQIDRLGLNNMVKPMPTFKVDTKNLLVNKALDDAGKTVNETKAKWETSFNTLSIDSKLKKVQAQADEVSKIRIEKVQSIEDINKIKAAADSVNTLLGSVQGIQKDVDNRLQMVKSDYSMLSKLPKNIQDAAEKDYQNTLDQLHINDLKSGNFAGLFIEESAEARINELVSQVQDMVDKAGQFKSPKPTIKDRYEGIDIHFGTPKSYPSLWIKLIHLSGRSKTGQIWDGKITDITSDQSKTKLPTVVDIHGQNVFKANCQMRIYGNVDLRPTPMRNVFKVSIFNYQFEPFYLFQLKEQSVHMTQGVGKLEIGLVQSGRYFDGRLTSELNQIQTDVGRIQTDSFTMDRILVSFVQKVDLLSVEGTVKGTPGQIKLGLSSNIDELFKRNFEAIWEEQLAEARAKVQAEIDKYTAQAQKVIMDRVNEEKKKVDDQLAGYNKQVKDAQDQLEARKKQLESQVKNYQNKLQQDVDNKKKEVETQAQKELDAKKKEAEEKANAAKKEAEEKAKKELQNQLKKSLPKLF